MRTPSSGFSFSKRSRIWRRTGMLASAHSMRVLPRGGEAEILDVALRNCVCDDRAHAHPPTGAATSTPAGPGQRLRPVRLLPGELREPAAEVAERRGGLVDRPAQVQRLDDALGRQREVLADEGDDACPRGACPCRTSRRAPRPGPRRRSRKPAGSAPARRGPPRRCSWRRSAPCRRPSGRPSSDPCPRTRRRRAGRCRRRCRR